MIEQLAHFIRDAALEGVTLTIKADGNDGIQVILSAIPKPQTDLLIHRDAKTRERADQLRAILAHPLVVTGPVGEVDVYLQEQITAFCASFQPVATDFSALAANTESAAMAHKSAKAKPAAAKQATTTSPADEVRDLDDDEEQPQPVASATASDSFESGEADSL